MFNKIWLKNSLFLIPKNTFKVPILDKKKGFFTKNKTFGNTTTFQKNRRNNTKHNKNISVSAVVNPDIFGVSNHNNSYDWAKENDIFQAKNSSESINASFGTNTKHIFPPHASQNVNYFSSEIAKVALSNASQINKLPLLEALQIANEMIWEAETSETSATIEKPIDFPIDPNIASITGLYFTTFAGINNTWILNSEAVDATVNSGKLNYLLDFGSTYGFATGYDFSPHWGLQIEWIVSSKQGQRYTHLEHGATTASTTDVNLVYTYLPVLAKFRMSKISKLTK